MNKIQNSLPVFETYAIFQSGGKQYQAIPGKTLGLEKLDGEADTSITFNEVLFRKTGINKFEVGQPFIPVAAIQARIIKQMRDKKIIVFKFKRRSKYRRKQGHRQSVTVVRIESI